MHEISVFDLSLLLRQPDQTVLIDVRREGARTASGKTLKHAIWRDPAQWLDWKDELVAQSEQLVFFCAHGREISQAMTAALCALGKDAKFLEGGFAQWQKDQLPVVEIASPSSGKTLSVCFSLTTSHAVEEILELLAATLLVPE